MVSIYTDVLLPCSSLLFFIGFYGVLTAVNFINLLINMELSLVGLNFFLLGISFYVNDIGGQFYALGFIVITAAESIFGFILLILMFKSKLRVDLILLCYTRG